VNLPNRLTVARFGMSAVFAGLLSSDWGFRSTVAWLLFGVASLTDYWDGEIARRRNLVTDFGALMDPLVDKVLASAAYICLVGAHAVPAWVAVCIIGREFLITGLRQLALTKGEVLPADRWGKHKTIWQIIMILYFFLLLSIDEWIAAGWLPALPWRGVWWEGLGGLLTWVVLILTVGSGIGYLWRNRWMIADR
jgi:CDP-diacylglycerol--glycerol-3-phosphate 3-phosphatidyltransferase